MLCSTCSAIFELLTGDISGTGGVSPRFTHHQTLEGWQAAFGGGCAICYQLWHRYPEFKEGKLTGLFRPGGDIYLGYYIRTRPDIGRARPHFSIYFQFSGYIKPGAPNFIVYRPGVVRDFGLHVYLYPIHQPIQELRPHFDKDLELTSRLEEVGDCTSSDQTFGLINRWIHECLTKHTACKHLNTGGLGWYPTRLLNVDTGREDVIRLQISSETLPNGPYVTLSHVWGRKPLLTLTPDNIQSMQKGISFTSLPRSFRDAIVITRRLGVKYIWIDSLCILQGGQHAARKDWEFEAKTMGQVFALSYLNIAATHARDSQDGCFVRRNPIQISHEIVNVKWGQEHSEDHREVVQVPYQLSYGPSLWDLEVNKAPLNQRGWVLQERLLAPRVVHFSSRQVFWECMELEASECFPGGDPSDDILPLKQTCNMKTMDASSWALVIQKFTESQLAKEEDKLIAIAGIAERFSEALNDVYVAGLWRNRLPTDLLWSVAHYGHLSSRPERYRAPSWSWASMEASIRIASKTVISQLVEVLTWDITTSNGSPYGLIHGGSISLRGPLAKVIPTHSHFEGRTAFFEILNAGDQKVELSCDCEFDEQKSKIKEEMYWLVCGIYEGYKPEHPMLDCLILLPVEDRQGMFKRVGIVEVQIYNNQNDKHELLMGRPVQTVTVL